MYKGYQRKRLLLWLGIMVLTGGGVFGMVKLVDKSTTSQTALLAEAVSASDWVKGSNDSKVVLIEYSDFQCPACGFFYLVLKEIAKDYGNKMQLVYRHFPLNYHTNSFLAAQAAEAAGRQGKFWEMHDLLFENQEAWANQSNAGAEKIFISYAQSLGLNIDQFRDDLNLPEIEAKVERDYQSGIKSGVSATPTFFLNGKKLPQPRSYKEFESTIVQAISANQ